MITAIANRGLKTKDVAIIAAILSTLAFWYVFRLGEVLTYKDAVSHMEIGRRVLESTSPGAAQLGSVWLPLPHVLMLPFVWVDSLFYSGIAGSIVSMAGYVVSVVLIFMIVKDLTKRTLPSVIGAAVFGLNPNVLYMQSTPMTETLLFAGLLGMVYGMQRWVRTDKYIYLVGASLSGLAANYTRYEGWIMSMASIVAFIIIVLQLRMHRTKAFALLIAYSVPAILAGIGGWMLWGQIIFGNAFEFQAGEYSKPSLWRGVVEPAMESWWIAIQTYLIAVVDNLHIVVALLALVGLGFILVRERFGPHTMPALSLLGLLPFFIVALHSGQRPLHVERFNQDLYNVRFGLVMILPAAILLGYMASLHFPKVRKTFAALLPSVLLIVPVSVAYALHIDNVYQKVITLEDPYQELQTAYSKQSIIAGNFLEQNYDGGYVLMESFGNELLLRHARIPADKHIYEGSYQLWGPAVAYPQSQGVEWIVIRHIAGQPDKLHGVLSGTPTLTDNYTEVFKSEHYVIYTRKAR